MSHEVPVTSLTEKVTLKLNATGWEMFGLVTFAHTTTEPSSSSTMKDVFSRTTVASAFTREGDVIVNL